MVWQFLGQRRMHRPNFRFRWSIYWQVPLTATRATKGLEVATSQTSIFFLPMKLRRGETFTGKCRRNSFETSGVRFIFFVGFQRIESVYVVTLCVVSVIVIGMLVTRRVKIWCMKFSLCILSAEGIKAVLLVLTLKAFRAVVNPPVFCSVVVP
jgi:hypothetical protein